jgi:hypothetical protein
VPVDSHDDSVIDPFHYRNIPEELIEGISTKNCIALIQGERHQRAKFAVAKNNLRTRKKNSILNLLGFLKDPEAKSERSVCCASQLW